jgi:hypothetical protein
MKKLMILCFLILLPAFSSQAMGKELLGAGATFPYPFYSKLFERWSGSLGQETGLYKWEIALGSCRSLSLRNCVEVNHSRGFPVKCLVPPLLIIKPEILYKTFPHLRH